MDNIEEYKEYLIKHCRYYKGEDNSPFQDDNDASYFWDIERVWVNNNLIEDKHDILTKMVDEYHSVGLFDFQSTDNIPLTLKAMLFNRFMKGGLSMSDAVEPFKRFYSNVYMKS